MTLADQPDDLTEESLLALGRCQMELGDPAMADLAFVPLIDSRDSARRQSAQSAKSADTFMRRGWSADATR